MSLISLTLTPPLEPPFEPPAADDKYGKPLAEDDDSDESTDTVVKIFGTAVPHSPVIYLLTGSAWIKRGGVKVEYTSDLDNRGKQLVRQ